MTKKYKINPNVTKKFKHQALKFEGPLTPWGHRVVNQEYICWSCGKKVWIQGDISLLPFSKDKDQFFIANKKAEELGWLIDKKQKGKRIEVITICPDCNSE